MERAHSVAATAGKTAAGFTLSQGLALRERLDAAAHVPGDVETALALARHWCGECCECGAEGPEWASCNLGLLFCLDCSGVHRAMGVHVSKVRSTKLDAWDAPGVALLLHTTQSANTTTSATSRQQLQQQQQKGGGGGGGAGGGLKPQLHPQSTRGSRDTVIRSRYLHSLTLEEEERKALTALLLLSVVTKDVEGVVSALKTGLEPPHVYPVPLATIPSLDELLGGASGASAYVRMLAAGSSGSGSGGGGGGKKGFTSPLHLAASFGKLSLVTAISLQSSWAGEGMVLDSEGWTPLEGLLYSRFFGVLEGGKRGKKQGKGAVVGGGGGGLDFSEGGEGQLAAEGGGEGPVAVGVVGGEGGSGGGEGATNASADASADADVDVDTTETHPLLAPLTQPFLEAMVGLLLGSQPRELRRNAQSLCEACMDAALRGEVGGAMKMLESGRSARNG